MKVRMTIVLAASLLATSLGQAQTPTDSDTSAAQERRDSISRNRRDDTVNRNRSGDAARLYQLQRLRQQGRERVERLSPPPARSVPANGGRSSGAAVQTE